MFGIADYGAFCGAVVIFLALPGPGTFALLSATGLLAALYPIWLAARLPIAATLRREIIS